MRRWIIVLAFGVLLGVPAFAAEPPARPKPFTPPLSGPFRDVPRTGWQYAAIQHLADLGHFTGYPDGTFAGKRALTRYEFAIALQRIYSGSVAPLLQSVLPPTDPTRKALYYAVVKKYQLVPPKVEGLDETRRLLNEFWPELKLLEWQRNPAPSLKQPESPPPAEEIAVPKRPLGETSIQQKGRKKAREAWDQGRASLLLAGCVGGFTDPLLGIPVKPSGAPSDDSWEELAAYNDETFRLVLERGWPPNSTVRPGTGRMQLQK